MTVETGKRAHFAEGAFWIVAIGLVLATVLRTRGILWSPDGLPAWDAAGYLLEGLKSARPLAEGDIKTLLTVLLKPDLHPPLHSFLLGCWLAIFGNEIPVVRTFPTVLFLAALGVLVWIGHQLGPRGRVVALGAAVLFTLSIEGVRYITTPMTENTALLFELVALGLAMRNLDRTDNRSRLVVGVAITLASLTRYNLAPMLLVPLYAHHVWRNLRTPRKLLDPGALLWAAPTFGFLAVWQLLRPDLARNISIFFVNRSSGLEFWSVENLFWVPLTLTRTYLNTPWLAVPLGALFLVSLLPSVLGRDVHVGVGPVKVTLAHAERLRLLQTFVVVSFGALTWHDYKIDRSLHAVAPFVYLSALWTLAHVTVTKPAAAAAAVFAPVALLVGVAAPLYVHQFKDAIPNLAKTSDFRPEPPVVEALAYIEKHARKREMVWVTGWVFRLSPPLIEYWLKSRGVEAKIKLDSPLMREKT
ncbi:MAG: ArnT family glycosyltransferase, partial [Myxococcota bacterium]